MFHLFSAWVFLTPRYDEIIMRVKSHFIHLFILISFWLWRTCETNKMKETHERENKKGIKKRLISKSDYGKIYHTFLMFKQRDNLIEQNRKFICIGRVVQVLCHKFAAENWLSSKTNSTVTHHSNDPLKSNE